jgi:hypothetical protein
MAGRKIIYPLASVTFRCCQQTSEPYGTEQESFGVEMRSLSGYSGSTVFVYWTFNSGHLERAPYRPFHRSFLGLLGVDWGHIDFPLPVHTRTGDEHPDRLFVKSHTSMSGVVPAWKLRELLNADRFKEQRINDEQEIRKK